MLRKVLTQSRRFSTASIGHNVPKTMRYMAHKDKEGPESITIATCDVPTYDPETEVLVKVEATAANRADLLQTHGKYPPPKGVTETIGLEAAGYLVDPKTNEITDRRVMALFSGGSYAQYAKVHKDHVMDIPKNLGFEQAAGIPEAWITAHQLVNTVAKIKEDETALIIAGASGVGTCMIQLVNMAGASAIAVASSHAKLQKCLELGAFAGVNYKQYPSYAERVQLITDGHGADVILDPVMGDFFNCNLNCLAMDSRWVIYGFMGGVKVKEANMMKLLNKRATIHTSTLRNRSDEYKSYIIQDMQRVCLPGFESGALRPIIDTTYNLSEAAQGLHHMEVGGNVGKIVFINDL